MTNRASRNVAPAKQPAPIKKEALTVIILAARMGRRMKSKGPKPLFPVRDGLTILDTQLQSIWTKYPTADVIIVGDFQYQKIRKYIYGRYPARIVLNPNNEDYGMMHAVGIGLQAAASRNVLIMYGDLVVNSNALNLLANASAIHNRPFMADEKSDSEIGVAVGEDMNVTNMAYGLPYRWSQMVYFTGNEFDILAELAFSDRTTNWMLHEGINEIINSGGKFISYSLSYHNAIDIDSPEDLDKVRKLYV